MNRSTGGGADFDADEVRRSVFGRTLAELCERHHLRCVVRLDRRATAPPQASTDAVRGRIVLTRPVLTGNEEEQAWSAAHEVGHLLDARTVGLRRYLPLRSWGWALLAVVAMHAPFSLLAQLPLAQQLPPLCG